MLQSICLFTNYFEGRLLGKGRPQDRKTKSCFIHEDRANNLKNERTRYRSHLTRLRTTGGGGLWVDGATAITTFLLALILEGSIVNMIAFKCLINDLTVPH